MNRGIFLDRDGTIIKPDPDTLYLYDPKQVIFYADTFEALRRFKENGFKLFLISNQAGVGSGIITKDQMFRVHKYIEEQLMINGVFFDNFMYCTDNKKSPTKYRKPNPGMILDIASSEMIDLNQSFVIGDKITDVVAGIRAGCKSIGLDRTLQKKTMRKYLVDVDGVETKYYCAPDLLTCVDFIINQ